MRARETGALQRIEYRFREHWYEARVVPCGDDEILAIARDITDLKNAEIEIPEAERDSAWLVNEIPGNHPTCSRRRRLIQRPSSARTSARHLGYSPEDFTGEPGFRLANVHPEDAPKVLAGQHLLLDEGHHTQELRFRTAKGNYRWIRDEATGSSRTRRATPPRFSAPGRTSRTVAGWRRHCVSARSVCRWQSRPLGWECGTGTSSPTRPI